MTALRDIRNVFSGQLSANEIEAFIKTNVADTQATNEHGNPLPPWNVAWGAKLSSIYSSLGVYDVRGNDMFQYQHKGKFIGNKYFDWRKVTHKDFPHFLFFNSLILKTIPVLPIQQDEIVGLTTGIFNFIANVLKIFTFGLSSGWRRPTITDYPHATKFPMVIPRSIYEKYLEIFKRTPTGNFVTRLGDILYLPAKQISAKRKNQVLATSIKEGLLPLGMFQHSEEAINTWLGAKDTTIALAGLLTNKITTTLYAVNDGRSNLQKIHRDFGRHWASRTCDYFPISGRTVRAINQRNQPPATPQCRSKRLQRSTCWPHSTRIHDTRSRGALSWGDE